MKEIIRTEDIIKYARERKKRRTLGDRIRIGAGSTENG